MPETSGQNKLTIVIKRLLRQPLTIIALAGGLLVSLSMQNLLPILLAVVLTAAYGFIKLRDEEFIRTAIRDHLDHQRREDMARRIFRIEELDIEARVRMKSISKLQDEIEEEIISSPIDEDGTGLSDIADRSSSVVERGMQLAKRRSELCKYLVGASEQSIIDRIKNLENKLAKEADPLQISEIQISLAAKSKELEDYHAIKNASDRILNELDAIETSLSSLKARLVRIKTTEIGDWTAANTELKTELEALDNSVTVIEQTVEEVLRIGRNE